MSLVIKKQEIDKESSKQFNRNRTGSEDSGCALSNQSTEDELSNLKNDGIEDAELCLNLISRLKNQFKDENLSLKQIFKNLSGQIRKDGELKQKNQSKKDDELKSNKKLTKQINKQRKKSKRTDDETKSKETKLTKIKCLQDVGKYLAKMERRTITISPKLTDKLIFIAQFGTQQPLEFAQESLSQLIKKLDNVKGALIFTQERAQYLNDLKSLIYDANPNESFSVLIELKNEHQVNSTIEQLKKLNGMNGIKVKNDQSLSNDVKMNNSNDDQIDATHTTIHKSHAPRKQRSHTFSTDNDLNQSQSNKFNEITKRHSLTNNSSSGFQQNSTISGLNSGNRINSTSLIRLPIGPGFDGFKTRSSFKKN